MYILIKSYNFQNGLANRVHWNIFFSHFSHYFGLPSIYETDEKKEEILCLQDILGVREVDESEKYVMYEDFLLFYQFFKNSGIPEKGFK